MLFDEGLVGLGRAVKWVYKSRVFVSADVPGLGKGVLDPVLIKYCRENNLMWVTKDWSAGTVDAYVKVLQADSVSAWWLRPEARKNLQRPEMLYAVARDIELILFALETETPPIFVVSSVGNRARHIRLPYVHRRQGARLSAPPKPRKRPRPRPMRGAIRLFSDRDLGKPPF